MSANNNQSYDSPRTFSFSRTGRENYVPTMQRIGYVEFLPFKGRESQFGYWCRSCPQMKVAPKSATGFWCDKFGFPDRPFGCCDGWQPYDLMQSMQEEALRHERALALQEARKEILTPEGERETPSIKEVMARLRHQSGKPPSPEGGIKIWITVEQDGRINRPPRLFGVERDDTTAERRLALLKKEGYRGAYYEASTGATHYIGGRVY